MARTQPLRSTPIYNTLSPAAPTATAVLFEPPAALTDGRREVWLAAGGPEGWGGCQVWGSLDGDSYEYCGKILRGAAVGELAAPLLADPAAPMIVDVSSSRSEIHPGSEAQANRLTTLCWVGGEMIAHAEARLVGVGRYAMPAPLRRGALGTSVLSHLPGAPFVKLDQAVFRMPYPAHWVGATAHVKLPAFNEFGLDIQALDEVPARTLLLTGAGAEP